MWLKSCLGETTTRNYLINFFQYICKRKLFKVDLFVSETKKLYLPLERKREKKSEPKVSDKRI